MNRSQRAGRRLIAAAVLLLLLPLGWIPAAAASDHSARCCTEQHLHAGSGHGACPQHECCIGTADTPSPRPTGTPLVGVTTPLPRLSGSRSPLTAAVTTPPAPPISRAHGAGLPLLC